MVFIILVSGQFGQLVVGILTLKYVQYNFPPLQIYFQRTAEEEFSKQRITESCLQTITYYVSYISQHAICVSLTVFVWNSVNILLDFTLLIGSCCRVRSVISKRQIHLSFAISLQMFSSALAHCQYYSTVDTWMSPCNMLIIFCSILSDTGQNFHCKCITKVLF